MQIPGKLSPCKIPGRNQNACNSTDIRLVSIDIFSNELDERFVSVHNQRSSKAPSLPIEGSK